MRRTPEQRARDALRAHAPDQALVRLGSGLDNTAFLAGDLVLRVAGGHDVRREAELLSRVRPRVSLPVPEIRFADEEAGVLAYPLLPGRPLLGRPAGPGLASAIGRFLRELHAIDVAGPVEPAEPGEWLEDLDGPPGLLRILRESVPAAGERLVLAHADLGAEHLLEHDGRITGVIDWTDAAVTDPALDFARLYRDFGAGFLAGVADAYGPLPDRDRIVFFARCAALEDLAYGHEPYVRAARNSLTWLFPGTSLPTTPSA
ncbi:hypothetical protein GCM10010112_92270 [Actinoplanes lobatus]|uniref:Aminoglycoside phosphotransferase (APT) family kinase protein n=1 Tax=Actinoplanes lobatus TaxID=113568 RepID=A0A7W7MJP7_9ACTN|nr:phosphotransferase [Actinoplanes lobatus]MBB4752673.1 aminoglycoside phosphotransferase (APT) family kinase protein [Actinoplanes lobatus]GGN98939.1 hypothetical protein GCM10010112_92270 [Actinoplanes lobatus]GIE46238.1 hypothetical protein Alo02nite_91360 [Actinoplanes lobatus]